TGAVQPQVQDTTLAKSRTTAQRRMHVCRARPERISRPCAAGITFYLCVIPPGIRIFHVFFITVIAHHRHYTVDPVISALEAAPDSGTAISGRLARHCAREDSVLSSSWKK